MIVLLVPGVGMGVGGEDVVVVRVPMLPTVGVGQ